MDTKELRNLFYAIDSYSEKSKYEVIKLEIEGDKINLELKSRPVEKTPEGAENVDFQ
jgi:hypothetical protein